MIKCYELIERRKQTKKEEKKKNFFFLKKIETNFEKRNMFGYKLLTSCVLNKYHSTKTTYYSYD